MNNHAQSECSSIFCYSLSVPLIFFAVKIVLYWLAPEYVNAHETPISLVARIDQPSGGWSISGKFERREAASEAVDIDNKSIMRIFVKVTAIAVTMSVLVFAGIYIYLSVLG